MNNFTSVTLYLGICLKQSQACPGAKVVLEANGVHDIWYQRLCQTAMSLVWYKVGVSCYKIMKHLGLDTNWVLGIGLEAGLS